ncbi:hypothetical protein ERW49_18630 [Aliivibrio finisterrensis]|uniref:Uncharacterized protein n=1 Tax=Aliivibrio finisterrensis TaxID=511998 RepID=A0A4Q5K7U8_9GAMM|nr:hypothetical protein [Aliivibrio finisterrensis]RYU41904.1 hypothetical protein ERW49_18630 [Aliivibrio finisterrensis]
MTKSTNETHVETEDKEKPVVEIERKELATKEILRCINEHGICPLNHPIKIGDITLTGARRVRRALVNDRIEAVRFSMDQYSMELPDAITTFVAGRILVFGQFHSETNKDGEIIKCSLTNEMEVPVDTLMYSDFSEYVNLAYMMGKN